MEPIQDLRKEVLKRLLIEKCLVLKHSLPQSAAPLLKDYASYYWDCKRLILDGEGIHLVSELFLSEINRWKSRPNALGGISQISGLITSAVILKDYLASHHNIRGSLARKTPKRAGIRKFIDNELELGTRIIVINDIISAKSSIGQAAKCFVDSGYEVVGFLAIVDGEEEETVPNLIRKFRVPVVTLFKRSDFPQYPISLLKED